MKGWLIAWLVLAASVAAAEKISPEVFNALKAAEAQLNADRPADALNRLEAVKPTAKPGTEQALVSAYSAYAYLALGRYAEAADAAQAALKTASLPEELRPKLLFVLGQAQLQRERFAEAAEALEQADQDPQILYLAAYARYRLYQFERAALLLRRAIDASSTVQDEWYRLLLACYLEGKNYAEAEQLIRRLIARQPQNRELWQQWLALNLERGRTQEALAAMVLAWHAGQLDAEQFLHLARLHAASGLPERAARLIQQWRGQKRLPETLDTLHLEAELWLAARERKKALPVLEQVAQKSSQGSDWLAAARIAAELELWQETAQFAQKALKSDLADPAEAELWLGIAAYHRQDTETAKAALTHAQRSPRLGPYARHWLDCLKGRRRGCHG